MSSKKLKNINLLSVGKIWLIIITAVIWTVGVALFYAHFHGPVDVSNHSNESWAAFGEYFGGAIGPILSFLALIAILWTVLLTRKEMKESQDSFEIQNFEKTFFETLHLLGDIVEDISIDFRRIKPSGSGFPENVITGRACFKDLRDELHRIYDAEVSKKTPKAEEYPQYIERAYNQFAYLYEHKIGHYFRFLYRIFKHIHESDPDQKLGINKKFYTGIVRATLSSNELALLFYDCFYKNGHKFAKLIVDYSLFENMEFDKLFDKNNHIPLFDKKAYGDEDWSGLTIDWTRKHF